jgi:hypothetical protein
VSQPFRRGQNHAPTWQLQSSRSQVDHDTYARRLLDP